MFLKNCIEHWFREQTNSFIKSESEKVPEPQMKQFKDFGLNLF